MQLPEQLQLGGVERRAVERLDADAPSGRAGAQASEALFPLDGILVGHPLSSLLTRGWPSDAFSDRGVL